MTAGNVVDYSYIKEDILKVNEMCPIEGIYYDSYNATSWAIDCTSAGLNMQPFSQALANFNRPTKEIERLIRSDKVVIDDNELTRFCFSNVVIKRDHNDNIKPDKVSNKNKIDGVIAMIQALGGYQIAPKPITDLEIFTF